MPLGILNNIPSLAAENQLTLTNNALQTTLQQLSSGSRINTGADDAAGLAIANGLQANVTALTQSVSNANNGVGELQLADGALAQVTTLLNRAVTLATESATGTVSDPQRLALQAEYSSILSEINRVGSSTTYNGQAVFQNGSAPNLNAQTSPAAAGTLNANDVLTVGGKTSVTAGGTTFTYTNATTSGQNLNEVTGDVTTLTPTTVLTATDVVTSTRGAGGLTTTYTAGAGATVGELLTAINTGASTANITVAGTDAGNHGGYQAAIVGGALQITDLQGNSDLGVAETVKTVVSSGAAFTPNAAATSTLQDVINAINNDTTVGAKAALVNGALQITDPQNRNDLAVTTTDPLLGAAVFNAPTNFTTPNTTGVATTNLNQLVGNTVLTPTTALTDGEIVAFDAGGKQFSFTAAGSTVADLLNAINNPTTDAAGLTAFLNANGNLVVTDPNNSANLKVDSTNTATEIGTLTSPSSTSVAAPTNIFLSDATAIGSSQIGVQIGALTTGGITNGTGGNAVNLNAAGADITTQTNAQHTLTLISSAIANVASVRGTLGASVNRLTAASNVINSQVQNLTSAENTITAADIPAAVASLTKYSILEQTGIAALAQANQQQQLVLKLLG